MGWSIPAGAGEPERLGSQASRTTVYPRGCGGTRAARQPGQPDDGLSPRVRGNPSGSAARPAGRRSIPAGAGEPPSGIAPLLAVAVYPRGCGGTKGESWPLRTTRGLSPRVRGNPSRPLQRGAGRRSIPAGAGEPGTTKEHQSRCRVYPRGCGGTSLIIVEGRGDHGLSPRVRGNLAHHRRRQGGPRSIPAGAGEPIPLMPLFTMTKVYPRGCGGTNPPHAPFHHDKGLSPRVRGNQSPSCPFSP